MHEKIKNNPCLSTIFTILVIIYVLYVINFFKTTPCQENIVSSIMSNFVHKNFLHLLSNLYGVYALTRIEERIGPEKFFCILLSSMILNSIFEVFLFKTIKIPCSIGFSGILYSIFTWEIMQGHKKFDFFTLSAVVSSVLVTSFSDKKIAIVNHFLGVISGIIIASVENEFISKKI